MISSRFSEVASTILSCCRWVRFLVGLLAVFAPGSAFANVMLKNGNFYVWYTDFPPTGGLEASITRYYNSLT